MNSAQAETAVSTSALVVAGIYLYRRLVETPGASGASLPGPSAPPALQTVAQLPGAAPAAQLLGVGAAPPVSRFVVGWGFVYVMLSLIAQGSPNIGGTLAAIAAIGAVLGNGQAVTADIGRQLAQQPQAGGRRGSALTAAADAAAAGPTVAINYLTGAAPSAAAAPAGPAVVPAVYPSAAPTRRSPSPSLPSLPHSPLDIQSV